TDGIHPNSRDYRRIGFRDGQTILNAYGLGGATYSGAGPSITAVSYNTNVVTVTTSSSSGLVNSSNSSTPGTLTGFVVTDGGGATISSFAFSEPNKILITMSKALTDPVTVSYMA